MKVYKAYEIKTNNHHIKKPIGSNSCCQFERLKLSSKTMSGTKQGKSNQFLKTTINKIIYPLQTQGFHF